MEQDAATGEQQALIETTRKWGYFFSSLPARAERFRGKRVLDVGMGGGPHAVAFAASGAASYIGVDPLVGSDMVRDFRSPRDPSLPLYHAFPYSVGDIERILPNVKLYPAILEDVAGEVRAMRPDFATMDSVTEHLEHPESVVRAIWQVLDRDGTFWANHHNYYSWTGHHDDPREVSSWDANNPAHNAVVDWKHLDPSHPSYLNRRLNRIRLEDMRLVVAKYFELQCWESAIEAPMVARLTPEIRQRWRKYSLAELLTRSVVIVGKRRDVPLDIDLTARQLFHPDERYMADRDYLDEDIRPYLLADNKVYFYEERRVASHSTNNHAAERIFVDLKPGDPLTVQKQGQRFTFTVDKVLRPEGSSPSVLLTEPIPEALRDANYADWVVQL
jgi:SAM-dependent methyltransferase